MLDPYNVNITATAKPTKYGFEEVIDRRGTNSVKWDLVEERFGVPGALPMWVADMDFKSPGPVIKALKRTAEHGIFGYACTPHSYYEAIIAWMWRRHGWEVQRDWITFSPGVVPALNVIIREYSEPGDEVIVQTPAYYPFFYAIERNRRRILDNPLRLIDGAYEMDLADLERKITPRTRIMLLCSPHNPVGRVWKPAELKALGEMCRRHRILVVADEIHHDLVYRGFNHTVFTTISPDLAEVSIVCTGASKTFNLPGLHTSNIIIPDKDVRNRFVEGMSRSGANEPNTFGVVATEAAYLGGEDWLEHLLDYLKGNLDFIGKFADQRIPGLRVIQPQGTYLLWLDFRGTRVPKDKLANFVCSEARVAVQSGRVFGAREDGFERMNIACPRATIEEGLLRIERAMAKY